MTGAALAVVLAIGIALTPSANAGQRHRSDTGQQQANQSMPTLLHNETFAYGNGKLLMFNYTQNYDCVDQSDDDLNFNGIPADIDTGEFQFPICQVGDNPAQSPQAGQPTSQTNKLYVIVPFFSTNNDQNPNDALACPPGVRTTTLCGPALGNTLIKLFGAIPEGFKTTPAVYTQCPNPGSPPGTCTMHASSVDLFPALVALGKLPASPQANVFVPTPNHSHVINMDLVTKPIWWQVVTVLVTNPKDWPNAAGTSGINSVGDIQEAVKDGGAIAPVPSNFFLFFGSKFVNGMGDMMNHARYSHRGRD
ncbi:MAG: hypothetical protein ACREQX_02030 [Candidatus Binataceae bacterium]